MNLDGPAPLRPNAMSAELVRPLRMTFWELRTAWATGKRIALTLERGEERIEGHVSKVAATNAFVYVNGTLVPADDILAVHSPSRLGDSTFDDKDRKPWHGIARRWQPQLEELPGLEWTAP